MGEVHPNSQITLRTSGAITGLAQFCNVTPDEVVAVLSGVVMKGATAAEMIAFAMVARAYGLDPLKREIYAFKNRDGVMVAGLYLDGWITLINRHPDFAGMEIEYSDHPQTGMPHSCTVTIHTKSRPNFPTRITEYFDECRQNKDHWQKWPRRNLRHKAIIQCARVAFGFAGIADYQEMLDRDTNLAPIAGERHRGSVEGLRTLGKPRTDPSSAVDVVASNANYALEGDVAEDADQPSSDEGDEQSEPPAPVAADTSPPPAPSTPAAKRGRQRRAGASEEKSQPPLPLSDDDIKGLLEGD